MDNDTTLTREAIDAEFRDLEAASEFSAGAYLDESCISFDLSLIGSER